MMDDNSYFGPYRVIRPLARGGMGAVYEAEQTYLRRRVALKVLKRLADDPDSSARFRREMHLVAGVSHPNLVPIVDAGEIGGEAYLAMELVEGQTLGAYLAPDRILEWPEVCRIGRHIAAGLACLHEHGIIHRDVKLANIMLDGSGLVKIVDFGLARQPDGTVITQENVALGTMAYMSPECFLGKPLTTAADCWAFGCVMYRMLTGHLPLDIPEGSPVTRVLEMLAQEVVPLRDLVAGLPADLYDVVDVLLSRDPDLRPVVGRATVHVLERLSESSRGTAGSPEYNDKSSRKNKDARPRPAPGTELRGLGESAAAGGTRKQPVLAGIKGGPGGSVRRRSTRRTVALCIVFVLGGLGATAFSYRPAAALKPEPAIRLSAPSPENPLLKQLEERLRVQSAMEGADDHDYWTVAGDVGFPTPVGMKRALEKTKKFQSEYASVLRDLKDILAQVEEFCELQSNRTPASLRVLAAASAEEMIVQLRLDVVSQLAEIIPRIIDSGGDSLVGLDDAGPILARLHFDPRSVPVLARCFDRIVDTLEESERSPESGAPNRALTDLFRIGVEFGWVRYEGDSVSRFKSTVENLTLRTDRLGGMLGPIAFQCWSLGFNGSNPTASRNLQSLLKQLDDYEQHLRSSQRPGADDSGAKLSLDPLRSYLIRLREWKIVIPKMANRAPN